MATRHWLLSVLDRRRAPRFTPEDLVCSYWTGAITQPKPVRDIGVYGACINSIDAFYPGTEVQMFFEDRAAEPDGAGVKPTFCIWSQVLRRSSDGFGVAFLFGNGRERRRFRLFLGGVRHRVNRPEEEGRKEDA